MGSSSHSDTDLGSAGSPFEQTCWSVILKAGQEGGPDVASALEAFSRAYWPPLYWFIRRDGYSRHDAQDLTQAFYQHFFERSLLSRVTERRGKFRSFLLTCLKHFLADQRDRAEAIKRGGGRTFIALDALEAEERYAVEPTDGLTADQVYERRWAQSILARVTVRLGDDYTARGKTVLFEALKDISPGQHGEDSYAEIGRRLGMSEQAIKNAVFTFRQRCREMLRNEVERTLGNPAEVDQEIRHLMQALARA